jgi:hypothetical protein
MRSDGDRLANWTPIRGPAADLARFQESPASRTDRDPSAALRAEPRGPSWNRFYPHRGPKDTLQAARKFRPFGGREFTKSARRVNPCLPEHLVDEHVSQTGHDSLIHQHGLERAPTAVETLLEAPAAEAERVGSELADYLRNDVISVRQPYAAEFSLVPEDKLPAPDMNDHAVVTLISLISRLPYEAAGHPEVEENRRTVGWGNQPFPVPDRLSEPAAFELVYEVLARPVTHDAGIQDLDRGDLLADHVIL